MKEKTVEAGSEDKRVCCERFFGGSMCFAINKTEIGQVVCV